MKLLRLRLENFRQHGASDIEFRDGMTAIVGPNGSGKSTILEAITFALYGEKRGDKNTVRFYWAPPRKPFKVTLEFEFDGGKFVVERGESDALLRHIDGLKEHTLANGLKAVTGACERLTSLNYEQFTNSFCAEQKGLAFLDFKTAVARQDEIARMLGYDRLKLAAGLGKERSRDLRVRITALQEGLGREEELKAQAAAATAAVALAEKASEAAEFRLAELDKALPAAMAARQAGERFLLLLNEGAAIAAKAEGLKTAVKLSQDELESARLAAGELARLRPLEAQFAEAEAALRTLEVQREAHLEREAKGKRIEEMKQEQAAIRDRLTKLGKPDMAKLETKLAVALKELEASQASLKQAEDLWREDEASARSLLDRCDERLTEAEAQLKRAQDLIARGICPECGQSTVDSGKKALATRQAEVETRKAERAELAKKLEAARLKPKAVSEAENKQEEAIANAEAVRSAAAEAKSLLARVADEEARAKSVDIALTQLEKEIATTPSTYDARAHDAKRALRDSLQQDHAAFLRVEHALQRVEECAKKHEAARVELEAAKSKYRALEDERKGLGLADQKAAEQAVQAHTELLAERRVAEKEQANAADLKQLHAKQLREAERRLDNLRKQEEAIRAARDDMALHDTTTKELLALRERLNETIRPELEARASDNLSLLTNARYGVLTLDDDFQALLIEDDIPKPVISGGEEDVVALSLRLALSELIQERQGRPMSLLILDEVFGSLDSDRRQSVLERLSAIKGRFAQVLVISHIEEINQVADQCLYVSRDSETRSARVTDAPPEFALVGA